MNRRAVIAGAIVVAAWPKVARAQQSDPVRRPWGINEPNRTHAAIREDTAVFRDALRDLGWTEGRNVQIVYRWTGGAHDLVQAYAAELVRMCLDVIFCSGATR